MDNKAIIQVLEEVAVLLELAGENPFKARSYAQLARRIGQAATEVETLAREKRLREIEGVGDALEQKLEELALTGRMAYHEALRSRFPETLFELFRIPGLGAKRIKTLYEELGIQSLGELEYACLENRLITLKGFGSKTQEKTLAGIAFARRQQGMHLSHAARFEVERLAAWLRTEPSAIRLEPAGSVRRWKEIVKDIDIVASSADPAALMQRFISSPGVESITSHGDTKSSVILESGIAADLRVVADHEYPYALHHFTGSREHNVAMRQRARERGLKMNEYGLFRGEENISCRDEAELFAALDLPFIPPELREDMGELDAAVMPRLVEFSDLHGVFHCHTNYSDGVASLEQMARAAMERGYRYIAIADHSQSAGYAGGLSPERVRRQHEEIDEANARLEGFRIIKGIESDIRADGSLDYDEETLARFEVVVASIHNKLEMTEAEATTRLVRAAEHPRTTIIGHPTGRLLLSREGYPVNFERLFEVCAANRTAIEINANPHRLDLDWRMVRKAIGHGVKLCISPDAHHTGGLDDVRYGLGVARKGWAEAGDLLNTMDVEALLQWAQ